MIENNIIGIILAGGKSSRFGEDKSNIRLGNKTFGRLISDVFNPYQVSNDIINSMALNDREIV